METHGDVADRIVSPCSCNFLSSNEKSMRHCRKDRWLRVLATAALSSSPHLLSDSDSVAVRPCLQHQRLSFNDNNQKVMINHSISCKTAAYQDATRNSKASLKEGQRNQLLQGREWIGAAESNITQTSKQSNKKKDCRSHSKTLSVKRRHSMPVQYFIIMT